MSCGFVQGDKISKRKIDPDSSIDNIYIAHTSKPGYTTSSYCGMNINPHMDSLGNLKNVYHNSERWFKHGIDLNTGKSITNYQLSSTEKDEGWGSFVYYWYNQSGGIMPGYLIHGSNQNI